MRRTVLRTMAVCKIKTKQSSRALLQVDGLLLVLKDFTGVMHFNGADSYERDSVFRRSVIQVIIITTVKHTVYKTECFPFTVFTVFVSPYWSD